MAGILQGFVKLFSPEDSFKGSNYGTEHAFNGQGQTFQGATINSGSNSGNGNLNPYYNPYYNGNPGGNYRGNGDDNPVQTQARPNPNAGAVVPGHNAPAQEQRPASFANAGTQNMGGLINNAGYTKGNGNGSVIFGGFDSSYK